MAIEEESEYRNPLIVTLLIWIPVLAVLFLGEQITQKELLGLALAGLGTLVMQVRRPTMLVRLLRRFYTSMR